MTTVGLIGCGSQKLRRPAPAADLYVGDLFKKTRAYVEATCDRWYVLSAKHGLVKPHTVLEPYDVKLGRPMPFEPERDCMSVHEWAEVVIAQLKVELADVDDPRLVVLAGEQYRTILYKPALALPVEVPMRGLGIGQQKQWLNQQLAALTNGAPA